MLLIVAQQPARMGKWSVALSITLKKIEQYHLHRALDIF
jgi:hypothetical protein